MQSPAHSNPILKARNRLKLDQIHPSLAERGLTPETIQTFGVGFCLIGEMAGRIVIPIRNPNDDLVAYAGRLPGEPPGDTPKYKVTPGFDSPLELFNLDRVRLESPDKVLIVVEGLFDAMRLHQLGHHKVVALMGNSLSKVQENLIMLFTDQNSRILLMLKEDDAGRVARVEMAARLARLAFVRIHSFDEKGWQPEEITEDELEEVFL